MEAKGYYHRLRDVALEARGKILELQGNDYDWKVFSAEEDVTVCEHFTGKEHAVKIDGIKDGELVINKDYVLEAGYTVSVHDVSEISLCILADFMVRNVK